ncbi:hypothetical protein EYF80_064698 [Liparis tanakae]|uniref:Uncharacterized protein n=1 Tax=Liparis tanakae TaxID=230148 RepID=A0A4Z2E9H8_9TELE|nr:hypothetical protein EYF80_064698 [Liparis tanakae]
MQGGVRPTGRSLLAARCSPSETERERQRRLCAMETRGGEEEREARLKWIPEAKSTYTRERSR